VRTDIETFTQAHLTYCPLCRGAGEELIVGEVFRYTGPNGELFGYDHAGGPLGHHLREEEIKYIAVPLEEGERVRGEVTCENCSKRIARQRKRFEAEVIAGGLHWTCEGCHKFGVIVRNDSLGFCADTRGVAGVEPPNQLGVRFTNCEQHSAEDEPTTGIQ
jgi:hypothetical protein